MPFPTTPVLDSFNRANEGPPPSSKWSAAFGAQGLKVVSNQCEADSSGDYFEDYWNLQTFGPDTEAYVTVVSAGTVSNDVFLTGRYTDPETSSRSGYGFDISLTAPTINLSKIVSGVSTQMGATISYAYVVGDKIGIKITGSSTTTVEAWTNTSGVWTSRGSRDDSSSPLTSAGYISTTVYSDVTTPALDDFGGGTIARQKFQKASVLGV